MIYRFTIPGKPVGKERPRFNTRSGKAFTAAKTVNYEQWVKLCFAVEYGDAELLEGALVADVDVYYYIPKGTSKVKRELMERLLIRPIVRPDLDNVAKIIFDALNGLAYYDDSQIVGIRINKFYDDDARIEVQITEIDGS